jgi:trehalose-6-phosphate hydrolase
MDIIREKSRDNSRTPMQWSNDLHAGFTTGEPWLKVADNYHEINVEKELSTGSIIEYYKCLIALRKEMKVISEGNYRGILMDHPSVYAYVREYEGEELLVLNHFYEEPVTIEVPEEFQNRSSKYLIGNGKERELGSSITLEAFETVAYLFGK